MLPDYGKMQYIYLSKMDHAMRKRVFWSYVDSEGPDHAQSDQGRRCLLIVSLDTIECINGEQALWWGFAHARDESNAYVRRDTSRKHTYIILTPLNPTFM